MKNIPEVWDDCKTKEQQNAFLEDLEETDATEKTIPFDDVVFEMLMDELGGKK